MSNIGCAVVDSLQCPTAATTETFINKHQYSSRDTAMSEIKYCKRCDRILPIENFSKDKKSKDGHAFYCKECASKYGKTYRESAKGVYATLNAGRRFYTNIPVTITQDDFVEWYESVERKCIYCDIPEDKLSIMEEYYNQKHVRLTVDRKDSTLGYDKGNLVLACNLCNLVKQKVLTFDEMRYVGQNFVKPKWKIRMER